MNRLKEFREEAMMTVRELSERSGVSEDTITKIENGHRKGRGMTLRKLAKALETKPRQLFPDDFERTTGTEDSLPEILLQDTLVGFGRVGTHPPESVVQYAYNVEAAIAQAYEIMHAIEQPAEKLRQQPAPARRYPDGVPRMNISERQQKVLITVLECGEVGPSTVAERLEISVSTAYRDLSVLEEHGLVVTDESGKRVISPLGKDLVEAIARTRNRLYYGEALNHIATLMDAYKSVAESDPRRATDEDAASFYLLQEITIRAIRRIVATAEPPHVVQPLTQKLREGLWSNSVAIGLPVDPWDVAREVWTVFNHHMTNPPSQQIIRADIEGVPQAEVSAALDMTIAAHLTGRLDVETEGHERMYSHFLWLLKTPRRRRYPAQQSEGDSPQPAQTKRANS